MREISKFSSVWIQLSEWEKGGLHRFTKPNSIEHRSRVYELINSIYFDFAVHSKIYIYTIA